MKIIKKLFVEVITYTLFFPMLLFAFISLMPTYIADLIEASSEFIYSEARSGIIRKICEWPDTAFNYFSENTYAKIAKKSGIYQKYKSQKEQRRKDIEEELMRKRNYFHHQNREKAE